MSRDNHVGFFRRVREALGQPGDHRRPAPPGLFPARPSVASQRRLKRMADRSPVDRRRLIDTLRQAAETIQLTVTVVRTPAAAAAAIADQVIGSPTEWGGPRQVCAWDHPLIESLDLPAALAGSGIPVVTRATYGPPSTGRLAGDQRARLRTGVVGSFVGITAADFCVADTATVVMRTRPGQPRSVSLVPSIHIAVIAADQIVADLKELYAVLRWGDRAETVDLTTCMTLVSGPSKTADIEATLVHGAHGPRAMTLVVIAPDEHDHFSID